MVRAEQLAGAQGDQGALGFWTEGFGPFGQLVQTLHVWSFLGLVCMACLL